MPNRILREGILTSEAVNTLTWPAEVFYRRLMSKADDHGRYDGRATILRAELYPLQLSKVSDSDIGKWIRETVEAGLVRAYSIDNKQFLLIRNFGQQVRSKSKWPSPPDDLPPPDSKCQQLLANAHLGGGGFVSVSEGGGGGGPPPPDRNGQPTNHPALAAVLAYFVKQGADYSADEIRAVFHSFEATASPEGYWYFGQKLVGDWRAAMETRLADRRMRTPQQPKRAKGPNI